MRITTMDFALGPSSPTDECGTAIRSTRLSITLTNGQSIIVITLKAYSRARRAISAPLALAKFACLPPIGVGEARVCPAAPSIACDCRTRSVGAATA